MLDIVKIEKEVMDKIERSKDTARSLKEFERTKQDKYRQGKEQILENVEGINRSLITELEESVHYIERVGKDSTELLNEYSKYLGRNTTYKRSTTMNDVINIHVYIEERLNNLIRMWLRGRGIETEYTVKCANLHSEEPIYIIYIDDKELVEFKLDQYRYRVLEQPIEDMEELDKYYREISRQLQGEQDNIVKRIKTVQEGIEQPTKTVEGMYNKLTTYFNKDVTIEKLQEEKKQLYEELKDVVWKRVGEELSIEEKKKKNETILRVNRELIPFFTANEYVTWEEENDERKLWRV